MPESWLPLDTCALAVGGAYLGGMLLGLFALLAPLTPGSRRETRTRAALTFGLLGLTATALAAGQSPAVWLPAVLPAAVGACGWLRRLEPLARLARGLVAVLGRPCVQAALLLVMGPALAGWLVVQADPAWHEFTLDQLAVAPQRLMPIVEVTAVRAETDAGRTVRLYRPQGPTPPDPFVTAFEDRLVNGLGRAGLVIRTAPAADDYNCHGWVFTGGRYCLSGDDIPLILEDNGYEPVSEPEANDLAIYKDVEGRVVHTGLVRLSSGPLLIEGKWGRAGRFLHTADIDCYNGRCIFYRSSRPGHLLRGLSASPGDARDRKGGNDAGSRPSLAPQDGLDGSLRLAGLS